MLADFFLALIGFILGIYIFMDFKKYFLKPGEFFSFSNDLIIKQNININEKRGSKKL